MSIEMTEWTLSAGKMMICMAVPKKLRTQKVVGILALLIVTLLPGGLTAQDDGAQPEKLLVAVIDRRSP